MTSDLEARERDEPIHKATGLQAPVVILGQAVGFLDVQPTVHDAQEHLTRERRAGVLALDTCEYYDGVARPLQPVLSDDGAVTLELRRGEPQPEALRARINGFLASARDAYEPAGLPEDCQVDLTELEPLPEAFSFARFLDTLDRRFNGTPFEHSAGRLHNFWHAVGG